MVIQFRGKELDLSLVAALNLAEARHGIQHLTYSLERLTPDQPEYATQQELCESLKAHIETLNVAIAKPEDWPDASKISGVACISTIDGLAEFKIKAIDHALFETILDELPEPKEPEYATESGSKALQEKAYRKLKAETEFKRFVRYVDSGWQSIPGANIDDKVKWVTENLWRDGELIELFTAITRLSGFGTGKKVETAAKAETIVDPAAWAARAQKRSTYQFESDTQLHTFALSAVSRVLAQQIDSATREPDPPERPGKLIAGRPSGKIIDVNDPKYKAECMECRKKRLCMYLEASLFPLPGKDLAEKMAWVSSKPAGEVEGLLVHIMGEINGYRSRVDFS